MRGRTRELCREANDSQNWFADVTGRVVSPALFYVPENIPRLRKRVLHEKSSVLLLFFPKRINSRSQFCVGFCAKYG